MRKTRSGISGLKPSYVNFITDRTSKTKIPGWKDIILRNGCGGSAVPAGNLNPDWWYIEELFVAAQEVLNESRK